MESELKCSFEVKLEGTHVIDKKQVHFGILTSSIFNKKEEFIFNATNRNNIEMINSLGKTIVELCKITPCGILVFFSSYGVMEDFIKKWEKSKIISEISKYKEFCQDKHDQRLNKAVLDLYQKSNSSRDLKGGILFSVCRGSCSEGMNFKNDYARLVIVVGIPYAYLGDPKTQLRKEYQDEFNKYYYNFIKDKKIKKLSGSEWYSQNAIKCVNQALGRVIRHSNDYGCMLLIDSRYQQNSNKILISKWIRDLSIIYNNRNNGNLISNAEKFFIEAESFINKKIIEKKKLDELKIINEKKENENNSRQSKNKKKKINNNIIETRNIMNKIEKSSKVILDDEFDEETNCTEENIRSNNRKKKNSLPQLNDNEHFNIINDIKIDEIRNNNNNDNKKKRNKNKNKINESKIENINTNENINSNEQILDIDLAALFGDDIKINDSVNENENEDDDNKSSKNRINTTNNTTNNNNSDSDKKENDNNILSNIELNDVGVSFFDSLKDEGSNRNSPQKKNKDNKDNKDNNNQKDLKGLSISELAEEIKLKQNNPDFREELKKKGLNFTLVDKNENENNENNENTENSITNFLSCPICFNNTKDQNIKMEVCGCGHSFCKNCLDRIGKENKKPKCPICKRDMKLKKRIPLYV